MCALEEILLVLLSTFFYLNCFMQCIAPQKLFKFSRCMEIDSEIEMPELFFFLLVAVPVVLFSIDIVFH